VVENSVEIEELSYEIDLSRLSSPWIEEGRTRFDEEADFV